MATEGRAKKLKASRPVEPRVDPARPVDPKAAELRAEPSALKPLGKALGPGLITGASEDDPSGIGSYAQAGAQYGFATLISNTGLLLRWADCSSWPRMMRMETPAVREVDQGHPG